MNINIGDFIEIESIKFPVPQGWDLQSISVNKKYQIIAISEKERFITFINEEGQTTKTLLASSHLLNGGNWKVIFKEASGSTVNSIDIVTESEGIRTIYSAASATISKSTSGDFLVLEDVKQMQGNTFSQSKKISLLAPSLTPSEKQDKSRYSI